uniref:BPTI/Kunitz inhibitor domain-containing protein n=1 Tax=Periophthalmus magnuspinnatus TaxID=409849 RepID=A0A3B4B8U0_9GOBI
GALPSTALLQIGSLVAMILTVRIPNMELGFCLLPKDEGTGTTFSFAVHYDPEKDLCMPFLYNGQGGNANRFPNEKECIRNCSANAENIYPIDLTKACHFPKAKGTCTSTLLRYYYDSVNDRCRKFHYTGCFGNGNRFTDINVCNATCNGIHGELWALVCNTLSCVYISKAQNALFHLVMSQSGSFQVNLNGCYVFTWLIKSNAILYVACSVL